MPSVEKHERGTHRNLPKRASKDKPMRSFLEAIPKERLIGALHSATDQRFQQMLACLCDPTGSYRNHTLSTLARRFAISLKEMTEMYSDYAKMEGVARMMNHLPDVLEDAAIDAKSRQVVCKRCDGTGEVEDKRTATGTRKCPVCKGKGDVRREGSKDARQFVGDATGLTGRHGPLVAQQFNLNGGDSLEDTIAITEKLLKGGAIDIQGTAG